MKLKILDDAAMMDALRKFVFDPNFPAIKDAFISSVPNGGRDATEIIHNSGKAGATIYVFNEMENLVRAKPKIEPTKREGQDPDLNDE